MDGAGGVFDRDGAKKEAKKGVVHLLLGHFHSGDHHHHQCEMETGHHNDLANQEREDKTQLSKFLPSKTTLSWNCLSRYVLRKYDIFCVVPVLCTKCRP